MRPVAISTSVSSLVIVHMRLNEPLSQPCRTVECRHLKGELSHDSQATRQLCSLEKSITCACLLPQALRFNCQPRVSHYLKGVLRLQLIDKEVKNVLSSFNC